MLLICCKVTTKLSDINVYSDLTNSTLFSVDSCNSTQDLMLDFLKQNESYRNRMLGLFTSRQFQGKGQRGNAWYAEVDQSLALTLAMPLQGWMEQDLVLTNKAISVVVCGSVAPFIDEPVQLKWPNDLFVQNQKLGGMLLQTHTENNQKYLILGIGLNVNAVPEPVFKSAVCMSDFTKVELEIPEIADRIFTHLAQFLSTSNANNSEHMNELYLDKLWKRNESVTVHFYNNELIAKSEACILMGVDAEGRLLIQTATGNIEAFHHGEVRLAHT